MKKKKKSLTKSPDEKFPWEQPPLHTEVKTFMKSLLFELIEKENYINLLGLFIQKNSCRRNNSNYFIQSYI